MNLFWRELRANQKSTLIWTAALSILAVVFLLMFPAFTKDVEASQRILSNLPLAVRNALDISLKSFFTIYGFFAYLFTFVALAGAVQAMNLGVEMISKEDSGKTADFLLTKPISRVKVVTSKLLAAACLLMFTNVAFSMVAVITARMVTVGDFSVKTFLLISATLLLIQMMFLALGLLFSVTIPKIKSVIPVSLPTVFTFFIIGMLGSILGNANVRYITPFKFYDPNYIMANGSYELRFLIVELVFIIIAVIASFIIYLKKDIRAVS